MSDSPGAAPGGDPPRVTTTARLGTGPPGRPSLGWTELIVPVVAYLVLSVAAGRLLGVLSGGRPATVPIVAVTGLARSPPSR